VEEEISNLQLSWEMLDLARAIWQKFDDDDARKRLADCHLALGEQAMEDEEFNKAITELEACIEMYKKEYSADDRRIAVSYFNIGLTRNLAEQYEQAVEAFKTAISILENRRSSFQSKLATLTDETTEEKSETERELEDLANLIQEINIRIQDCTDSHAQGDAKVELRELTGKNGHASGTSGEDKEKDNAQPSGADKGGLPTDVSHLVRKSVKHTAEGDGAGAETVTKKAKMDTGEMNGQNGHGDKMEEVATKDEATA